MSGAFAYAAALGACAGLAAGLLLSVPALLLGAIFICAIVALVLGRNNPKALVAAAALAAAALGLVRADFYLATKEAQTLQHFAAGEKVALVGTVVSDPDPRDASLHANVSITHMGGQPVRGTLVAFLPPQTQLVYGAHVSLTGKLELPEAFQGDNGNIFDYPGYLEVQGVSATLQDARLTSAVPGGVSLLGMLYALRGKFNAAIARMLPEPESSLLEGILLGERRGLSANLTAAFVAAGLIHIVILAGYVLSLVADALMRATKFLPRTIQFPLVAVFLILFVLMTGAAATTVRACAMALVGLLGRYFHRPAAALRVLALVAAGMVLWNPPILFHDASFIISVISTFGLITLSPWVLQQARFIPERWQLREIVTSTLCVQLMALPALLYYTGTLSFLSIPANLLALPILPWVMLAGFVGASLTLIPSAGAILALVPAAITTLLLKWILLIVGTVQAIPFSATTVWAFPAWGVVALYIPLVALALWSYTHLPVRAVD